MEKRRKIFEGDGTTVEEIVSTKPKKKPELAVNLDGSISENKTEKKKIIRVEDMLDTFAGYLPATANFTPKDGGTCLICGKETSSSMRKICFDCLQKHGEELYNKAKKSLKNGEIEFQI